ncbi:MAG: tripartite tricarboxylate transporter substrate binding protein BugD [Alcaligenaceae bacterium]|nr:tripartite tricarboxylate transporter substrate binding protein BugD [Alcaligenaceae bacterium SAGV5]MPS51195.1 tripartite tricarboxylate transporter substrate binding protein BugD [Alcaligenaceae bacterium SAGV3]MPT57308.1 tripartite tricarboxylate transporter substrate binding protein BugD [Alcaligenaceae bacterium]
MGMVGGHAVSPAAAADSFPSRPITLLVPFSAGGPTDKLARDLSEAMRQRLGQTVVVENIGGAGGTIGAGKVANARPDGYTLMLVHVGMATWPALYPGWERKTLEAFDYLGLINEVPMTLVGRPTLAPKNIDELTSWLKGNHDKVNLANGGPGSASDLCGLQLQEKLGIKLTTIPYKGTGPAMIDLMGNQLDLLCTMTIGAQDQIKGGKIKGFAVTSLKRVPTPELDALPTLDESGLKGFNVTIWHGLYAPRNTPPEIRGKLNGTLREILASRDFVSEQERLGALVVSENLQTPAGHREFVEGEISRWTGVLRGSQSSRAGK